MIVVLRILSGEEIIGRMECEDESEFDKLELYELFDPMWIVPNDEGAMKLRDALMLSENISLIFNPGDVITCYKPIENFAQYYKFANEYSTNYTRAYIAKQIDLATQDLKEIIRDEKEYVTEMSKMLRKVTGSKLH